LIPNSLEMRHQPMLQSGPATLSEQVVELHVSPVNRSLQHYVIPRVAYYEHCELIAAGDLDMVTIEA